MPRSPASGQRSAATLEKLKAESRKVKSSSSKMNWPQRAQNSQRKTGVFSFPISAFCFFLCDLFLTISVFSFSPCQRSTPGTEKLDVVPHVIGSFGCHEPEKTTHLVADRVALLQRQDQTGMGLTLRLKTAIIGDIETIENPSFPRRKGEVVLILPLYHVRFVRGKNVQPSRP